MKREVIFTNCNVCGVPLRGQELNIGACVECMNDPDDALPDVQALRDHVDLMVDELHRIRAITDNDEIRALCDRGITLAIQKVPIIKQRDALAASKEKLLAACKMFIKWQEQENQDDPEVEELTLQTVSEHIEFAVKKAHQ